MWGLALDVILGDRGSLQGRRRIEVKKKQLKKKKKKKHGLNQPCRASSLFNQIHSLRCLNYWASVCSHSPLLKSSTRVLLKTTPTHSNTLAPRLQPFPFTAIFLISTVKPPFFLKPQQLHNFNQPHTLSHFAASKWIYRTSRLWRLCLAAAFTWVLRIFNLQVDEFLFTWCQAEHPAVQIRLWVAPGSHNSNLATEVESGVSVEFNLIVVTVERWIRTFNALKKKIPSNPICRWHENSWDQMITYCRGTIDEEMADCSDCWVSSPVLEVPDSIVPDGKYYET